MSGRITKMSGASLGRRDKEGSKAGQHRPMRRTGLRVGDQAILSQNSSWPNEALLGDVTVYSVHERLLFWGVWFRAGLSGLVHFLRAAGDWWNHHTKKNISWDLLNISIFSSDYDATRCFIRDLVRYLRFYHSSQVSFSEKGVDFLRTLKKVNWGDMSLLILPGKNVHPSSIIWPDIYLISPPLSVVNLNASEQTNIQISPPPIRITSENVTNPPQYLSYYSFDLHPNIS
jgi:hypothetical protein